MPNTTGLDLKLERVRARLTVTAVAAQMGLSRQSVHGIERAADPGPERVRQHRAAVAAMHDATETASERPE
jgi:DNA-binding XRE family transcriptional regulator